MYHLLYLDFDDPDEDSVYKRVRRHIVHVLQRHRFFTEYAWYNTEIRFSNKRLHVSGTVSGSDIIYIDFDIDYRVSWRKWDRAYDIMSDIHRELSYWLSNRDLGR